MTDTSTTHPDDCRMCEAGEPMAHNYEPPVDGPEYPFIPLTGLVHDNSETVTDYAFMRHRSPGRGVTSVTDRDNTIALGDVYPNLGYTHHQWHDVNPDGQRSRFDMIVNRTGHVVYLFHTEYFTRVACRTGGWCHSYASYYVLVTKNGEPTTDDPLPFCDEHTDTVVKAAARHDNVHVHKSERLFVGQHD